jgi:hypothetical protein
VESVNTRIGRFLRKMLDERSTLELDGHCVIRTVNPGEFEIERDEKPKVYIAYVEEDLAYALKLHDALEAAGLRPWIDKKQLLPGQNWSSAIQRAISVSDYFVPCFSRRAVKKRGMFFAELRFALDCAGLVPLDDVYLMPIRLDDCDLPCRIVRNYQYLDMFPDWDAAIQKLVAMLFYETSLRRKRELESTS